MLCSGMYNIGLNIWGDVFAVICCGLAFTLTCSNHSMYSKYMQPINKMAIAIFFIKDLADIVTPQKNGIIFQICAYIIVMKKYLYIVVSIILLFVSIILFSNSYAYEQTRRAYIYIPVYNSNAEARIARFLALFSMPYAEISECTEHYIANYNGKYLKIHKYTNKIEFEFYDDLDYDGIMDFAVDFMENALPHKREFEITSEGDLVIFRELIDGLPNYAHPTIMSINGERINISHYFYDFEVIDYVELLPVAEVARQHDLILDSYRLAYIFEHSILMPAYIINGEYVVSAVGW